MSHATSGGIGGVLAGPSANAGDIRTASVDAGFTRRLMFCP